MFLSFVPEFSADCSAPPEFSSGVPVQIFSTGWEQTFDLQITNQILYQYATASLCSVHSVTCWDIPAVSVVTGWDFPAVSVITGRHFPVVSVNYWPGFSSHICSYWPGFSNHNCSCWLGIFRPYLQLLALIFGRICNYWPGFSSRICSYLPGFSGCIFSGMRECKKSLSRDQKAGIFQLYL